AIAAGFVTPNQLALGSQTGDIVLFEHAGAQSEWRSGPVLKAAVSSIGQLVAHRRQLLVAGNNGYGLLLNFDGTQLKPVAFATLPTHTQLQDLYYVIFHADERVIDVIQQGSVDRIHVSALPVDWSLDWLVDSRGLTAEKSERDASDWLKTLMGRGIGSLMAPHLVSLDPTMKCRLAIDSLLSAHEARFLSPARIRSAERLTRERCSAATADGADNSVSGLILNVLHDAQPRSGWPHEWSRLIRAAERGDQLALRAFIFALKSSENSKFKGVARATWDGLVNSAAIMPVSQTRLMAAGGPVREEIQRYLVSQMDAVEPNIHLSIGYMLERQGNQADDLARALFHFWIAEELFGDSGRAQEEAVAAKRRASLTRMLSDDTVQVVRRNVASWSAHLLV